MRAFTFSRLLHLAALSLLVVSLSADASDELWTRLAEGGRVVLMRHAVTTSGVGDPPGMRIDDCATQRNLTDEGRRHARRIGEAFRARGVPVERVLSSPWCRCLETARLAFARAEPSLPLGNLFGRPENAQRQVEGMRALIAAHRARGNLVLVSHGSTIVALTGVSLGTGEMVVVTPQADRFVVNGRLSVSSGSIDVAPTKAGPQ